MKFYLAIATVILCGSFAHAENNWYAVGVDFIPPETKIVISKDMIFQPNQDVSQLGNVLYNKGTVMVGCSLKLKASAPHGLILKAPITLTELKTDNDVQLPMAQVNGKSNKVSVAGISCLISSEAGITVGDIKGVIEQVGTIDLPAPEVQ